MNLRELLDLVAAAAELSEVAATTGPDGARTWVRDGVPFAVLRGDGTTAEFALDAAVASAAVRTPDTSPSPRGAGWVAFHPPVLDEHAADRATAWFASAYRRLAS